MKIFISGILGFISSNVANRLYDEGFEIFGCDNLQFGYAKNLNPKINWIEKSFDEISEERLNEFDVLLHMACANIIYAQDHSIETFKTNALDSIKLIEKFKGKVVYTSTSSVYGNAIQIPTPESSTFKVSNAYDQSKLITERYLKLRGNYTTLRLSNVYGKNQRPENPYAGVIGKFIGNVINNEPYKIYGDGCSTRDYTYIDDVVEAIILACFQDAKNTEINIGTGKETSILKLISVIHDIIDQVKEIKYIDGRKIDGIRRRCLDIRMAKELLGWQPNCSIQEGLKETIKWNLENYG
jgi:UDP-glucose 4-epimerase